MSTPVSWEVAERVASWVGAGNALIGTPPVKLDEAAMSRLRDDFDEATERAEKLVVESTGLRPLTGSARAQVVDRAGWARNNIGSFRRLLEPLLEKMDPGALPGPLAGAARGVAGAQLGFVIGWMATRVLGQYDLLLTEGDEAGDVVSYVGPNVVGLERRHGFPAQQFRLWIALHEVTHRCQFTGVPWLKGHFLSMVDQALVSIRPDPRRVAEALLRAAKAARSGKNPLDELGLIGLVATPEQLDVVLRIQAMMSLLEGHGDVTMSRAGTELVPDAPWFARVLRERRSRASLPVRLLQQLFGIEAKLRQYAHGERFVTEVEAAGGPDLLAHVWEGPEQLPTLEEIREPQKWVTRIAVDAVPIG